MDIIDRACQLEEEDRARALAEQAKKPAMQPCWFCYNCDACLFDYPHDVRPIESLGCFCDPDCRDDYQKREKQWKT